MRILEMLVMHFSTILRTSFKEKTALPEGPALPPVVVVVVEEAAEMEDEAVAAAAPLVAAA